MFVGLAGLALPVGEVFVHLGAAGSTAHVHGWNDLLRLQELDKVSQLREAGVLAVRYSCKSNDKGEVKVFFRLVQVARLSSFSSREFELYFK